MIGVDALELELADLEGDAIAWRGKHFIYPISEFEHRDAVARQRLDLPHDLLPRVVCQRDVVRSLSIVDVGNLLRAVVVQDDLERKHRKPGDLRPDPHGDAIVAAPILFVERALKVH